MRTKVVTVKRWYAQDEVNQEDSEQNEVDGMKKGADSKGKVMHVWKVYAAGMCGCWRAIWNRTIMGHYDVTETRDYLTLSCDYAWLCWGLSTANLTGW